MAAVALFTINVQTTKEWTFITALAQFYSQGSGNGPTIPLTPNLVVTRQATEAALLAYVHSCVKAEMKARVENVLVARAQAVALAALVPPTLGTVT